MHFISTACTFSVSFVATSRSDKFVRIYVYLPLRRIVDDGIVSDLLSWMEYDASVADSRLLHGRLMDAVELEAWMRSTMRHQYNDRQHTNCWVTDGAAVKRPSANRWQNIIVIWGAMTKLTRVRSATWEAPGRCRQPVGVASCVANNNTLWRLAPVASLSPWIRVSSTLTVRVSAISWRRFRTTRSVFSAGVNNSPRHC